MRYRTPLALVVALLMVGCAQHPTNADPWEKTNRFFYKIDDGLDKYGFEPAANAYVKVVPKPIRNGIGNGFENLGYGDVILNDFLQSRWRQGWADVQRMAVNSTV